MEFFFKPRGIAVVGATPSPGKGGNLIIKNMLNGYDGKIYPVNPRYEQIEGLTCYRDVSDVPDPVDLAVVFVSSSLVVPTIQACAHRGIAGAMIQSAGFSEAGEQGRKLQDQLVRIASETGIRLWGPNCMGLVDAVNKRVFSTVETVIWDAGMTPGNVSLIVQSGMLAGAFLIDVMTRGGIGISKSCSIGNKMDVDESDILEYLMADDDTAVIGLYLESIVDGPRFMDLCRKSTKPIVLLKGGRSEKGARAAMSHTASLAGNGAVVSGALAQCNVVAATDFNQMMDICRTFGAFTALKPSRNKRLAVLTYSGGAGIVSTDFFEDAGLELADLSPESCERIQQVFPDWMPAANPVDLWPGVIIHGAKSVYNACLEAVCQDPHVDAVFVHNFVGGFALEPDMDFMVSAAKSVGKPLVCWLTGERHAVHEFQIKAQQLGLPVFREIHRAVECLAAFMEHHPWADVPVHDTLETLNPDPVPAIMPISLDNQTGVLDENRSKAILKARGIPVVNETMALNEREALAAAQSHGFPVVMKGIFRGMVHKTEAGLVRLGVKSAQEVEVVYAELLTAMDGRGTVLVQQQVPQALELIVGMIRDPQFGVCVMCGMGGVLAEVLGDTVFGVAPLTEGEALALIARMKSCKLLDGFRGGVGVDRRALAQILVRVGQLGLENKRIREIDINPLIPMDGMPVAVDASIILNG
ncbi:SucC3 [Desulforapulum autotrophicum HRM2]|uniref:SucC3 n=1 Tax=Desulforapulum autotrophicum (strain ATCC 43914 / DSM 3382 / VKM B-1955 / HRM2) TaxID=177437 RepID=C0QHU4_DESAH|nr:acetate--CoA ligase family protein [Desulforapulum autotrophicum]ACN13652.1 SucC3 [Desulforapulum autotrophicum HRM2]